jgi:hypothetical protein
MSSHPFNEGGGGVPRRGDATTVDCTLFGFMVNLSLMLVAMKSLLLFDLAIVHMFEFEFVTLSLGQLTFGHVTYNTCKMNKLARYF